MKALNGELMKRNADANPVAGSASDDRIFKNFCSLVVAMREQRRHREIGRKMLLEPVSVTNEKEKTRDTAGFFGTAGAITVLVGIGGGPCWIRTSDQRIKSPLLYQLS